MNLEFIRSSQRYFGRKPGVFPPGIITLIYANDSKATFNFTSVLPHPRSKSVLSLQLASQYAVVIQIMNTQIKHKLSQDNGLPIASVDNFPEKGRACFGKLHQIHLLGIPFHYRVSAVHLWGGLIVRLPLNSLSHC